MGTAYQDKQADALIYLKCKTIRGVGDLMIIPHLEHEVTTTYAVSVWLLKSLSVARWSPQKFHSLLLQSRQEFLPQVCLGSSLLDAL